VAVVPESVPVLARAGVRVLVEPGAGTAAWFPDEIQVGVVVTHQGTVVHPAVAALLGSPAEGGSR